MFAREFGETRVEDAFQSEALLHFFFFITIKPV